MGLFDRFRGGKKGTPTQAAKGSEACSGCGYINVATSTSISLQCPKCSRYSGVAQNAIDKQSGVRVTCPHCFNISYMPPSVWCPICKSNLLPDTEKIIKDYNVPTEREINNKWEILFRIPINEYTSYLPKISDLLGTKDVEIIDAKRTAYCTKCWVQFTSGALGTLIAAQLAKNINASLTVFGDSRQGNDLRAGVCPNCGNSEMMIVIQRQKIEAIENISSPVASNSDEICQANLNPPGINAWTNKGNALYRLGNYNEAIQAYDNAIKLNLKDEKAWYGKGNTLGVQKKYDKAIQAFDKAIEINPQYVDAWMLKGFILSFHKPEEAIKVYDKTIQLDPQNALAWTNKGNAFYRLGIYNEALRAYDNAIKLNPRDAEAWYGKGNSLGFQAKYNEAIQAFNKAIELNPKYAEAWYEKGYVLKLLGQNAEANAAYSKAKELGYSAERHYPQANKDLLLSIQSLELELKTETDIIQSGGYHDKFLTVISSKGSKGSITLTKAISMANEHEEVIFSLTSLLNISLNENHVASIIYLTFALCTIKPKSKSAALAIANALIHCLEKNIPSISGMGHKIDFDIIYDEIANTLVSLREEDIMDELRNILKGYNKLNAIPHILKVIGLIGGRKDVALVNDFANFSCPMYDISERMIQNSAKGALNNLKRRV